MSSADFDRLGMRSKEIIAKLHTNHGLMKAGDNPIPLQLEQDGGDSDAPGGRDGAAPRAVLSRPVSVRPPSPSSECVVPDILAPVDHPCGRSSSQIIPRDWKVDASARYFIHILSGINGGKQIALELHASMMRYLFRDRVHVDLLEERDAEIHENVRGARVASMQRVAVIPEGLSKELNLARHEAAAAANIPTPQESIPLAMEIWSSEPVEKKRFEGGKSIRRTVFQNDGSLIDPSQLQSPDSEVEVPYDVDLLGFPRATHVAVNRLLEQLEPLDGTEVPTSELEKEVIVLPPFKRQQIVTARTLKTKKTKSKPADTSCKKLDALLKQSATFRRRRILVVRITYALEGICGWRDPNSSLYAGHASICDAIAYKVTLLSQALMNVDADQWVHGDYALCAGMVC